MQVFHLGRAPCTKETLPDFLKWRRVTRHPLVFRGLTGSQRTPMFWGVTLKLYLVESRKLYKRLRYIWGKTNENVVVLENDNKKLMVIGHRV